MLQDVGSGADAISGGDVPAAASRGNPRDDVIAQAPT